MNGDKDLRGFLFFAALCVVAMVTSQALVSCGPPPVRPNVACSGGRPISCTCATSCDVNDAGVLSIVPDPAQAPCIPGCFLRGGR